MAVVDKQFEKVLGEQTLSNSPLKGEDSEQEVGTVELTSYEANRLSYKVKSQQGGVVVFSEIYYPGWTCTIDGQATEIARANYVLRAIKVPAGEHEVVMTFDPQTVHITEAIAYSALAVLAVMLLAFLGISIYRKRQKR